MRSSFRPVRRLPCRLALQSLETRDVPAGTVNASLSPAGLLTITGDDNNNGFTIRVNASDVVLQADASTMINAGAAGNPIVLSGIVKSIKADLKGGNDSVSLDPSVSFNVPGSVSFILGDGDNLLDLTSSLNITMGSLLVKGGDGEDIVTVQGGVGEGSRVNGAASFSFANGGSNTTLGDIDFASGVKIVAGDGTGTPNDVTLATVEVAKVVAIDLGNSNPSSVTLFDASIGGLKQKGQVASTVMIASAVLGSVSIKGGFQADLQMDSSVVTKNVTISAAAASFDASGDGSTINGNLALSAQSSTQTSFQSDTLSEVMGNIKVKGGWYDDLFVANGLLKVNKNVVLTLAGGDNQILMGDGVDQASILGNLSVKTGDGADLIELSRLAVGGNTTIKTFAGKDEISFEFGSTFTKNFLLDAGTGDDIISMGQFVGSTSAVVFSGKTKIVAGVGNDTVSLGLALSEAGDANSRVVFSTAGSSVDGGLGLDTLNPLDGQFSGLTPTGFEL